MINWLFLVVLLLLMSACASTAVLNTENATMSPTPEQVSQHTEFTSELLVWGGVIVAAKNLQSQTQLEILAYPLRRDLRPNTNVVAIGRFLLHHAGYLETEDYAPGRKLTVVGTVKQLSHQTVFDASYNVPVLQSEQQHLWPIDDRQSEPRFSFGLGIFVEN